MSGEKQDFTNSNEGEPFFLVNEFLEKEKNELEGILEVVKRKNMKQYLDALKNVMDNGIDRPDRTGVGSRAVFAVPMRFNLEDDFANWPEALKQKYFNVVVISEVLEHLFEPEKLLLQLKRLGKADKSVIITVPNILFWKNRLKLLLGSFNYTNQGLMDRGHIHFFSWQSFKRMIAEAGYEIVGINNHIPTRGTKWLGKIWPGLFSFQFIVKIKAVIE